MYLIINNFFDNILEDKISFKKLNYKRKNTKKLNVNDIEIYKILNNDLEIDMKKDID